jgi:hypothetical protein
LINLLSQKKHIILYSKIILGLLGFVGASIILILTSHYGTGLTPDSVAYISAARNLSEGNGFLTYNGTHLVAQPPLYPILLAVIKKIFFIDPVISAGYVNAILFGLIIYFSGLLLFRYLKSFALVLLGTVFVLISYVLVQTSLMALTEPLFIFLVILVIYFFEKYQSKKDFVSFFLFSISVAMACLTRYTGITIVLTGVICICLWGKGSSKEKFLHSLVFIIITIIPVGIWILRNYVISGTLIGQRAESSYTLVQNLEYFYLTVFPWFLPLNSNSICFIIILLIVTALVLYRIKSCKSWNNNASKLIGPTLLFVLFYSATIVVSSTTTAYDKISDRLLSPTYIPIVIILFFITDKGLSRLAKSINRKLVTGLFVIIIVMLMRYPAKNTKRIIDEYQNLSGWGYSCNLWKESETIKYLSQNKTLSNNCTLISNEPAAVYILTNLYSKSSPAKTYYNSNQLIDVNLNSKNSWPNYGRVCIIWFDNTNRNFLYSIDELKKKVDMTEVIHLKDGEIYTFSK